MSQEFYPQAETPISPLVLDYVRSNVLVDLHDLVEDPLDSVDDYEGFVRWQETLREAAEFCGVDYDAEIENSGTPAERERLARLQDPNAWP